MRIIIEDHRGGFRATMPDKTAYWAKTLLDVLMFIERWSNANG